MQASHKQQANVIDRLKRRIRKVETAGRVDDGQIVSSGCTAIDGLLPSHGYARGTLVQWLTAGGQGADYLSLLTAMQACRDGGALVVIDRLNHFNPVTAAALGVNLDHLIVLRNASTSTSGLNENTKATDDLQDNDFLWSIDQALRCPAVAAVWGWLDEIDDRWFRRFQLSAEASGCIGLFIQPLAAARAPTWAEVQWLVQGGENGTNGLSVTQNFSKPMPSPQSSPEGRGSQLCAGSPGGRGSRNSPGNEQHVGLQLTRCHGTHTGKKIHLAINTVTGSVTRQGGSCMSFNRVPSGPRVPLSKTRGDAHAV